jgi:hypothetical protein
MGADLRVGGARLRCIQAVRLYMHTIMQKHYVSLEKLARDAAWTGAGEE